MQDYAGKHHRNWCIKTNELKSTIAEIKKDQVIVPEIPTKETNTIGLSNFLSYTNPAKDVINFDSVVKTIIIYDLQGRVLQTKIVNGKEMNISILTKGVYILIIQLPNRKVISGKLTKE